jgi:hypothetical protein
MRLAAKVGNGYSIKIIFTSQRFYPCEDYARTKKKNFRVVKILATLEKSHSAFTESKNILYVKKKYTFKAFNKTR